MLDKLRNLRVVAGCGEDDGWDGGCQGGHMSMSALERLSFNFPIMAPPSREVAAHNSRSI